MELLDVYVDNAVYTKVINGVKNLVWVERFFEPGEFKLSCEASDDFLIDINVGSIISHTNTLECMVIENKIIEESKDGTAKIEFSGRSLDVVLLEKALVTNYTNVAIPGENLRIYSDWNIGDPPYGNAWIGIKTLLEGFLKSYRLPPLPPPYTDPVYESYQVVEYYEELGGIQPVDVPNAEYVFRKLSTLYENVYEILKATNSGMKLIRKTDETGGKFRLIIHRGFDKSSDVIFSFENDSLENIKYLYTSKNYANTIHVYSEKYGYFYVPSDNIGYQPAAFTETMGYYFSNDEAAVDAGDLSEYYADPNNITLSELYKIRNILKQIYAQYRTKIQDLDIVEAVVSKKAKYKYGIDYNIGDVVTVNGKYGISKNMRVIEHALTMDETGITSIPTLSV